MTDVQDFDIHRYLDGEMTREEVFAFERRMEADGALAMRVAEMMQDMDTLRDAIPTPSGAHLDSLLSRAEPASRPIWGQLAAAVVLLAVGFGGGLLTRGAGGTVPDMASDVLANASAAHALYSVEVVHPVEVPASERDHLKGWLSNRLGSEVRIPDLTGAGLSLVGGRLLPFEQGAAAQFMYEDAQGARVTLYLTPAQARGASALRYGQKEDLSAVYWQDGLWHYALVGPMERDRLSSIAQSVQGALF